MFKSAKMPDLSEFNGEYFVDMLTVLPNLRKFSHRKVFYTKDNRIFGHNILLTNRTWGHFFIEKGDCKALNSLEVIIINYSRPENSFITNKIRDHLRCIEQNKLYLGRFNYFLKGRFYFLGYFSLSKL